jgi:putative Mg2+ transporter-C (MgtC) family protein
MTLETQFTAALYLLLAAFLSAVVGLEREHRHKNAGLRTHILVGVGACLFTLLSLYAFPGSETARIAANIVVGIGFLGAGVIYRSHDRVHDLTTAANIWVTAAIGMAVGTGAWFLSIAAALLVWFILRVLYHVRARQQAGSVPAEGKNAPGGTLVNSPGSA